MSQDVHSRDSENRGSPIYLVGQIMGSVGEYVRTGIPQSVVIINTIIINSSLPPSSETQVAIDINGNYIFVANVTGDSGGGPLGPTAFYLPDVAIPFYPEDILTVASALVIGGAGQVYVTITGMAYGDDRTL
jgi:hypothetical protein